MTKQIYRNNYFHLDFYWQGIMLGFVIDSEVLTIIIPFFALEINLYMFKRRKSKNLNNQL
jgi:hypothetical protein